jgi:hypothetical protein
MEIASDSTVFALVRMSAMGAGDAAKAAAAQRVNRVVFKSFIAILFYGLLWIAVVSRTA